MTKTRKQLKLHVKWNEDKTQVTGFIGKEPILELVMYEGAWVPAFEAGTPSSSGNTSCIDGVKLKKLTAIYLLSKAKILTIDAALKEALGGVQEE